MDDDSDDEALDSALDFIDVLGEHTFSDKIKKAFVWAAIQRFVSGTDREDIVNPEHFSDNEKSLAKAMMFHGPFDDIDDAEEEARNRRAIIVVPTIEWTDESKPFYVVSLSN